MLLINATLAGVSELMQALFTAGLLVVAIIAAGFAWAQLRAGRQATLGQLRAALDHEKRVRVYELVDRTTHLEFVALTSDALRPFPFADTESMEHWWADDANNLARQSLVTLLNFCDEVAEEYLDGILDRRIADQNIAYVAASVWGTVAGFVEWYGKHYDEKRAWERLKEFADGWELPPSATEPADPLRTSAMALMLRPGEADLAAYLRANRRRR